MTKVTKETVFIGANLFVGNLLFVFFDCLFDHTFS